MMVKVLNENHYPYEENFRGKNIRIEPGKSIEMDHGEAVVFLGTMPPNVKVDKNGLQDPKTYKKLRIVKGGGKLPEAKVAGFRCEKDGKVFQTEAELKQHIADNYAEDMVDEDARDEILGKPKKRLGRSPRK